MPSNLTSDEQKVLEDLQKNINIVGKRSDKGGNIILMDKQEYINMVNRLLNDSMSY